jgi:hypothetical protein
MNVLKLLILLPIASVVFGVEEDEVAPEFPIPNPFQIEDFQYEIVEIRNRPETAIGAGWSGFRDYRLELSHKSSLRRLDLRGNLQLIREEDFTPTERRLLRFEMAVPMRRMWAVGEADYYFRKRDGDFRERRSSFSSQLESGLNLNRWTVRCFGQAGVTCMESSTHTFGEVATHFSRRYGTGASHLNLKWEQETGTDSVVNVFAAELGNTYLPHKKMTVHSGLYCGGWDNLHIYPHIRILIAPLTRVLFKTRLHPEIKLIGSSAYLRKEFSVPGRPVQELHPIRWSTEVLWSVDQLNSVRARLIIDKVTNPVVWAWDALQKRLVQQPGSSCERRVVEVRIQGGSRGVFSWHIGTRVNRAVDKEGYQIPNDPLSTSAAQMELRAQPFILSLAAYHCGKRFANNRERDPLEGFLVLSFSLGLEWGESCFSFGVENLTGSKYELYPLVFHRGRKYLLEFAFSAPD